MAFSPGVTSLLGAAFGCLDFVHKTYYGSENKLGFTFAGLSIADTSGRTCMTGIRGRAGKEDNTTANMYTMDVYGK